MPLLNDDDEEEFFFCYGGAVKWLCGPAKFGLVLAKVSVGLQVLEWILTFHDTVRLYRMRSFDGGCRRINNLEVIHVGSFSPKNLVYHYQLECTYYTL
jgi:hypothetical protein